MSILEAKEWSNLWWEEAPDLDARRVLLVGDSIANGYRHTANSHLAGRAYATVLATSKAVDNRYFIEELEYVWRQNGYRYEMVHFNNGLHGAHMSAGEYAAMYETIVRHILERHPEAALMLALSTPVLKSGAEKRLDPDKNAQVIERNQAVLEIAARYQLPVHDLYSAMLDCPDERTEDGYHFNALGAQRQGRLVAAQIAKVLGLEVVP